MDKIIWTKTRIATIDREIFDTNRAITERLLRVRQSKTKIICDQKDIAQLNIRKCQLNRKKSALLTFANPASANDESQATASSRTKNEGVREQELDEIVSKMTKIGTIDEKLFDIDKNIAKRSAIVQRSDTRLTFIQETVTAARRHADELRRQKTELLDFLNEADDRMKQAEVTSSSTSIDIVHEMNNKYTKQERRLKQANDEPQATAVAAPPRANLQTVYESKSECNVCMTEYEGKDIVYLNDCTHTFCKYCVTRAKPQHQCMECRQPVSNFYSIEKCGERYKLKNYQMYYNFIEDRPMRPAEFLKRVRTRIVQNDRNNFGHENNPIAFPSNVSVTSSDTSNVSTEPTADGQEPTIPRPLYLAEPSIEI